MDIIERQASLDDDAHAFQLHIAHVRLAVTIIIGGNGDITKLHAFNALADYFYSDSVRNPRAPFPFPPVALVLF